MNMNYLNNQRSLQTDFFGSQMSKYALQMSQFQSSPNGFRDYFPSIRDRAPTPNLKKNGDCRFGGNRLKSHFRCESFKLERDFRGSFPRKLFQKKSFNYESYLPKFKGETHVKLAKKIDQRRKRRFEEKYLPNRVSIRSEFLNSTRPKPDFLRKSFNGPETFDAGFFSFECARKRKPAREIPTKKPANMLKKVKKMNFRRRSLSPFEKFPNAFDSICAFGEKSVFAEPKMGKRGQIFGKRGDSEFLDCWGGEIRSRRLLKQKKRNCLILQKKYLIGNKLGKGNSWFRIYRNLLKHKNSSQNGPKWAKVDHLMAKEERKYELRSPRNWRLSRCISEIIRRQRVQFGEKRFNLEETKSGFERDLESPFKGSPKIGFFISNRSEETNENESSARAKFGISEIELGPFSKIRLDGTAPHVKKKAKNTSKTREITQNGRVFRRSQRLKNKRNFILEDSFESEEQSVEIHEKSQKSPKEASIDSKNLPKNLKKTQKSCDKLSLFSDPEPEICARPTRKSDRISMRKNQNSTSNKPKNCEKRLQTRLINIRQIKRGTQDYKRVSKYFALPLKEVVHNDDIFDNVSETKPDQLKRANLGRLNGRKTFSKYHQTGNRRVRFGEEPAEEICDKQKKSFRKKIRKNGKLVFQIKQNFGIICSVDQIEELKLKFKGVKRLKALVHAEDSMLAEHLRGL